MARDRAVHQRLGEGRLVGLVVPVPAIAEQIDDDVLFELLAVFRGDAGGLDDGLGIITVDVEDRRLDALCHIRGMGARPRGRRARRKAYLVVDDNMDRPAGAEAGELRQFERFGNETLAGEGRITMHQNAGHPGPLLVAALILLCPNLTEHDRVDRFEMRWVGRQ